MSLATKLVSIFMIIILLVIAADGWWSIREETEDYERLEKREVMRLATTLRATVFADVATREEALAIVERVNGQTHRIPCRWVWFGADEGPRPHAEVSSSTIMSAEEGVLFPIEVVERDLRLGYVVVPVGAGTGGLELHADAAMFDELRHHEMVHAMRVAGLLLLLSAVAGVFFGHRLLAVPLRALVDQARRIGQGDLEGRVDIRGRDELSELGTAMNRMCEDLRQSRGETALAMEQLRHADRLSTVGRLAAGLAHELGTPLNVVSGRAGMIASGRLGEEEARESAGIIKSQSDRMTSIVRQLLDFARASESQRRIVDICAVVDQTGKLLAPMARKHKSEIVIHRPSQPIEVSVDPAQMQQVLTNLVVNAGQSMPGGGQVEISIETVTAPGLAAPLVRVDVADRGAGIPDDIAERVFDPFFTTKDVGQGTGMGLSVAYGIVQEHGGWIAFEDRAETGDGPGTRFSVYLPRKDA